jgi:hypothetical protein
MKETVYWNFLPSQNSIRVSSYVLDDVVEINLVLVCNLRAAQYSRLDSAIAVVYITTFRAIRSIRVT